MFQSPVFKKIFTSSFKEATTCRVELPGKNVDSVIHMLDYLYPTSSFMIDGRYCNGPQCFDLSKGCPCIGSCMQTELILHITNII